MKFTAGVTVLKPVKKIHTIKRAILPLVIVALPIAVHAAGLGKISVLSALGQPLKAEIGVLATSDEAPSVQVKLAATDAFSQAEVEYAPVLANLKFSPVKERDGRRYIEVTTDRPVNDPFIDMLVELNWASGRLVREYTFLLDPPDQASATATAPAPVAAPEVKPAAVAANPAATNLPPRNAPAPAAKKPDAPVPAAAKKADGADKQTYKVAAGDTLGKIASQNLPAGVSLDQMLVALLRNNEKAFSGNNMNRLRAGKILDIPDSAMVGDISASEARQEVVAQAADFNAYRKKLAAIAGAGEPDQESVQQSASGKIVPKVADAPLAGSGKDKLEISRSESAKEGKSGKAQHAIAEEDLVARDKALKEANSRTAELEKNLSNMKKLAELKSQAGADLQKQAQATKAGNPVVESLPAEPGVQKPAAPGAEALPVAAKPVEAPQKKKMVLPPPEPEPEPGFIEENQALVFGGGGLLALVLGWFGFTSWKKRKLVAEAAEGHLDSDFSAHSGFSTAPSGISVTSPPNEPQSSQFSGNVSRAEPVMDALNEADTFLAFGRDAQAEEVLLASLETEPDRHATYLKLLDIYAARKDPVAFEAMAKRLRGQTGGAGVYWEKAVGMGALLDPENALYKLAPLVAEPFAQITEPATMVEVELPQPPTTPVMVDFELDTDTPVAEAVVEVPETNMLDFDLDLGAADAPVAAQPMVPMDADAASAPLDLLLTGDAAQTATLPGGADANNIDFDFDFDLDLLPDVTPAKSAAALDTDRVDLDLNALDTPAAVSPAPIFDVTGGAGGAENPEVATKLELAAAYEEMGDREGARELYQEALVEGGAGQKEAARSKLASLG